jgi:hypothetical protein
MRQRLNATSPKVLGHAIPPALAERVTRDCTLGLLDEGWFIATAVVGGVWFGLGLGLVGTAFWPPGQSLADGPAIQIGLAFGLAGAVFGGWWHRRFREMGRLPPGRREAALHELVGLHRLHAAALLLFIGLAALVQAWQQAAWLGLASGGLLIAELACGYRLVPAMLRWAAGEPRGALRAARLVDRFALLALPVAGLALTLPVLDGAEPAAALTLVCHVAAALAVPWSVGLLAVATLHLRAARRADPVEAPRSRPV